MVLSRLQLQGPYGQLRFPLDDVGVRVLSLQNTMHIAKNIGRLVDFQNKQYASSEYITIINEALEGEVIVMGNIEACNIMEFLSMVDAAYRAGAEKISLVIPYFSYARQDKIQKPYSSVGFEIIAKMINVLKVNRIITIDIHSPNMLGLFDCEVINIVPPVILSKSLPQDDDFLIIAPDKGSLLRINSANAICLNKIRKDGKISFSLDSSVQGKNCFIYDDILDSGATIRGAIDFLYQNGAKKVKAFVTHILGKNIPKEVVLTTDSFGKRRQIEMIDLGEIIKHNLRN